MKAIILETPGDANQLKHTTLDTPVPAEGEVLIGVKAISINPVDVKTRAGKGVYGRLKAEQPLILGWDVSGIVAESNSPLFKKGDEVFGMVNFPGHGRAYAEYVAAPASHVTMKPGNISHGEAAAAALAALTAWQVLHLHVPVAKGNRVLIHAAAGGVGHYAVQLAKEMGAYVVGTSGPANREYILGLGADEHFDYTQAPFETTLSDFDFVFDAVGGDVAIRSLEVLRKGGIMLSIPTGLNDEIKVRADELGVVAMNKLVQSSGDDMHEIALRMQDGRLKSTVSHTFPFEKMAEAHRQIETGRTRGKIIVTVN